MDNFVKDLFFGADRKSPSNLILFNVAMILVSFLFVYTFSYSTSFGYHLLGLDSAVFQVVGKYWAQGYLPYVDLFDHKGPIIYLANAIGYAIYPRAGVMIPQIIFLYLSCLFLWRSLDLFSSSNIKKIFFALFMLIFYAAHYEEGNHVEEYSVLFLSATTYCFLRSLKENRFAQFYGFVYGLCFGGCFLIRLTDSAQICCEVFFDRDFSSAR